jgi:uncharacterized RDD family membrane protein YckC
VSGDLVTGEAVVVELRLARFASRGLALMVDALLLLALGAVAVFMAAAALGSLDDALATAVTLALVVGLLVGVPVTFETLTRGRTLGKMALGLRVVRDDGGPIGFRHALIRGLVGVVELWLLSGAPALICSLANSKGKRLGDLLAGTVVVRERMPSQSGSVAAMPPGLAGWAAGLDLSRLPDDLALAARQYVARAGELMPSARDAMGGRLADAVAATVSPPPPPGVPPYVYLSAVLAERRNRETARLHRTPGVAGVAPQFGAPPYGTSPYGPPQYGPPQYAAPQYGPHYAPPQHPDGQPPYQQPAPYPAAAPEPQPDEPSRGPFAPPS